MVPPARTATGPMTANAPMGGMQGRTVPVSASVDADQGAGGHKYARAGAGAGDE